MNRIISVAFRASASAFLILAAGCASGPGQGPRGQGPNKQGPAAGLNQTQMLLARARQVQSEQGCARAVPTYRVVASFGEDYEVAQYELGACLIEIDGVNAHETALFREEGLLWIKRAAWGGNARAQHRLAHLLSGAGYEPARGFAADPQAAMGWALVYQANPARSLYALPDVADPVLNHLRSALSDDESAAASAFAADFDKIALASFTPPAAQRGNANSGRRGPPDGVRPDRRRADNTVVAQTP